MHTMTMVGRAASLDSVPLPFSPTASVIVTATYTKALSCINLKHSAIIDTSMLAHMFALSTKHHDHLLPLILGVTHVLC